MIAHPDSGIDIPIVLEHPEFVWHILCLTSPPWQSNARILVEFWESHNINCIFLGYTDPITDTEQPLREISNIVNDYDLIVADNNSLITTAVNKTSVPKVYFSDKINYNTKYHVTSEALPLIKQTQ